MQFRHIYCPSIQRIYNATIVKEAELAKKDDWLLIDAAKMWKISETLFDHIEDGLSVRKPYRNYGLTRDIVTPVSEAAHINLVCVIVDQALIHRFGPKVHYATDGLTYREIMDMIRRPGALNNLVDNFNDYDDNEISETKWLIYLASRTADIMFALHYDIIDEWFRCLRDGRQSEYEYHLLNICESSGFVSEMWTIDFFEKQLPRFDNTGFFTQLVIMATLQARGVWYKWREKKYQ